jgi:hypothetical protein
MDEMKTHNLNLSGIVAAPAVTITPLVKGSSASTLGTVFPAQSIAVLVLSQM